MTANPFFFLLLWLFVFMGGLAGFYSGEYIFLTVGEQIGQLKKLPPGAYRIGNVTVWKSPEVHPGIEELIAYEDRNKKPVVQFEMINGILFATGYWTSEQKGGEKDVGHEKESDVVGPE